MPTTCDGCALGYYYVTQWEACVPYDNEDQCPNGWFYDTGQESCVPYGGQISDGCTTFTVYVPDCSGPTSYQVCDEGYYYDTFYNTCLIEPDDACAGVSCGSRNLNVCEADGCCQVVNTSPPGSTPNYSCEDT